MFSIVLEVKNENNERYFENRRTNIYAAFMIKWNDGSDTCSLIYKEDKYEVIGNIYENEELIKGK